MKALEISPEDTDTKLLTITSVNLTSPYTLTLIFATGEQRVVDFELFLRQSHHPDIRAYLDPLLFQQFKLVDGNVNWNNYDLIFPVADLYHDTVI